jgi:hypothetical protein
MITHHTSFTASDSIGCAISNRFKYVPSGTGPADWGSGDQLTFLIAGEETCGAFFMAVSLPPRDVRAVPCELECRLERLRQATDA